MFPSGNVMRTMLSLLNLNLKSDYFFESGAQPIERSSP